MSKDSLMSRRAVLGAAIGAAALSAGIAAPASAIGAESINGQWKINGNGHVGDLVVQQAKGAREFSGTIYGEPIWGAYSALDRIVVLLRGQSRFDFATQIFIGHVSPNGQSMSGTFFAMTDGYGASQKRIEYSFAAVRGSTAPSIPPLPVRSPAPEFLDDVYSLTGTFPTGTTPRALSLNEYSPGAVTGGVDVSTFGDPWASSVGGRYAKDAGTLILRESRGHYPRAVLVGNTDAYGPSRIGGAYYALSTVYGSQGAQWLGPWDPIAFEWNIIVN